jgi:hypothetical protein
MRRALDRWIEALSPDIQGYPHRSPADAIASDFRRTMDVLEETMTNAIDTGRIMEQIRENQSRLDGCKRHRFPALAITSDKPAFRHRYRCDHCGGEVDATAIMNYCAGYEAAGGDPADVWSPYRGYAVKLRQAFKS